MSAAKKQEAKAQHNPGPWAVGITSPEKDPFVVTADSGDKYHRRCIVAVTEPRPGVGEDVARANAHLIAAAPDMLEALEKHLAWYDGDTGIDEGELIASTRAAIAKARRQS